MWLGTKDGSRVASSSLWWELTFQFAVPKAVKVGEAKPRVLFSSPPPRGQRSFSGYIVGPEKW